MNSVAYRYYDTVSISSNSFRFILSVISIYDASFKS
jgi:hypothetical protein